jgi:hypothetical protein
MKVLGIARRMKNTGLVALSFLHGIFLLMLGYIWLGMTYTFGDEAFLIKWSSLVKKEILNIDPKPSPNDVLFINTSTSKVQVFTDADPLSMKPATELITDRIKLAGFLDQMIPFKDSIRLIVLDVLFDRPSTGDSLLQEKFDLLGDKLMTVSYMPAQDAVVKPDFKIPYALATYRSAADMFFKYPVIYRGYKTLPTAIYEKLTGSEITRRGLFFREGKKFSLKAPITDFKVRMNDFKLEMELNKSSFAVHNLETVTALVPLMDKNDIYKMYAGKLIMIGDFNEDIHKTSVGVLPGMLIIYNAYLTLLHGDHIMKLSWILLIIIGFTWISYRVLTGKGLSIFNILKQKFSSGWIHFIIDSIDELFFLSILTLLSYFFFNIQINILILFIYLKLFEFGIEIYKNKRTAKS